MQKILVTGNAGSGKSTLGRQVALKKGLKYTSLDKVVWQENWKKAPKSEQQKAIAKILAGKTWVVDGVSDEILKDADQIIFLDFKRRVCFYRALKRNSRYLFSSRPELPANCPEILIIPKLLKIIWRFPGRVRPKILAEKTRRNNDAAFIHIRSRRDIENYLNS